jgi:hypothetical protein
MRFTAADPRAGAAQVVTIADLDFLDHPERPAREIRRDYAALAARHAARADHIVTHFEGHGARIQRALRLCGRAHHGLHAGRPRLGPAETRAR